MDSQAVPAIETFRIVRSGLNLEFLPGQVATQSLNVLLFFPELGGEEMFIPFLGVLARK